ncbi:MAG: hypothetical protein U5J99_03040 [Parvularculaceae bacterium]|nr:hypothetical protein [Parvularculaceae bacterium]
MRLLVEGLSAVLAAAALLAGVGRFSQRLEPIRAPLPLAGDLAEVSGLAPAGEASVYAHNDEQATIHEIDVATGRTLRTVSLGRPPVIGDFAAIVAQGQSLALITSGGQVFEATIGPCRGGQGFFIACKRAKGRLVLYR